MKILFSLAALSLMAGCATTPTPVAAAKNVPLERVYLKGIAPSSQSAKLVFVRDEGILGAGTDNHIFINDGRAASLSPGEKFEINLQPGEYILGVKPTDPFGATAVYSIDQTIMAGRTYFYRLLTDSVSYLTRIQRFQPSSTP